MTDNNSFIRLSKASKEFNVGIQTLIDYLAKKGSKVDGGPNSKITESDYAMLAKEFAADRDVKSKIQSVEHSVAENKPKITEGKSANVEDDKMLIIKSTQMEVEPIKMNKPRVLGKIDLGMLDKPPKRKEKGEPSVAEVKKVAVEQSKAEPKAEPVIEPKVDIVVESKVDVAEKVNGVAPKAEPINNFVDEVEKTAEVKVNLVKVEEKPIAKKEDDLVAVVSEKKDDVVETPKTENIKDVKIGSEDKKEDKKIVKTTKAVVEVSKNETHDKTDFNRRKKDTEKNQEEIMGVDKTKVVPSDIESNKDFSVVEKVVEEVVVEKKDEDNFLKTKYVKLDGPNVLRTIDLSQFNKPAKKQQPVASSSEDVSKNKKNKRKRIKGEVQVSNQSNSPARGAHGHTYAGGTKPNAQQTGGVNVAKPGTGGSQQHHKTHIGTTGNNVAKGANSSGGNNQGNSGSNAGKTWRPNTGGQQQGAAGNKKYQGGGNPYKKGGVKDSKPAVTRVEPTDEEVKKQIQETLARLSPTGKSKASKHKRDKRELRRENMADAFEQEAREKLILKVSEFVTVNELATMMDVPVTQVISTCMNLGMFVSINMRLDAEALAIVADEFGFKLDFVGADIDEELSAIKSEDSPEDLVPRPPIVTVMGHVDHGKTKLLDYIRNANVVAGEAGGITQHIGAYEVTLKSGKKIAFLDTPGHEAFTAMRARGAEVTDVAIIVIAADDSVMPQTKEAINHAQAANVPIVFAFNKVDKPTADVEKIKNALAQMNILVEDWGGKYQCQEISAKTGLNISELLDKVLLEAEILDLRANPDRAASGTIIESSLDKGRGYVAKIMVQNGTLRVGDVLIAGCVYGKVKAMYNERNQIIKEAGPSTPLLLLGLSGAPQAGDKFVVMADEKEAKSIVTRRQQLQREQGLRTQKHITLDEIGRRIAIGDFKELNIIVKGDVDGSVEALSDSLLKLSTTEVQVNVIHRSVGQVTESDVLLASASNAIIVAFQVRPSVAARKLAEAEQIDIRMYSIIYNAIEEIKSAIEGMLSPEIEEKIICNVEVRETFKIPKVGTIAGCMVLDGVITRNTKIRVIRDGIVVYNGTLGSLKRFKDDVKEVKTGYECGLNVDNYNDIKIGDIIEGYEFVETKRTLS